MTRAETESETGINARSRSRVGTLILLVSLYVLSVGPVEWLDEHCHIPNPLKDALIMFYSPVRLLRNHSRTCRQAVDWYVALWRG